MVTNTIPVITEIIIWGKNWFTNPNAHLLHMKHCWSDQSVKMLQHQHSVTDTIFALFIFIMQKNNFTNSSKAQFSFESSPFVGPGKSAAAQTFQSRSVNLAIIAGIKILHSLICTGGNEELWNHEELRYCQCYRKTSFLLAFKPTIQTKVEIHSFSSGSLHNGNRSLPFGRPHTTPYFK